jgi:NAD(P)H-dependent FMN reductase
MRILAISGSLRASSTNTKLVRAMVTLAPADMHITTYEDLGDLPHFSPDRDGENSPASVSDLRAQLQAVDGVLICTPEYAFGVPGSLKNALDWTVSTGDFSGKPTAVVSASPLWGGGDKAHASLLLTLTALGANVLEQAKLSIPHINKKLNDNGEITDAATAQALSAVLAALAQAVKDLHSQQ